MDKGTIVMKMEVVSWVEQPILPIPPRIFLERYGTALIAIRKVKDQGGTPVRVSLGGNVSSPNPPITDYTNIVISLGSASVVSTSIQPYSLSLVFLVPYRYRSVALYDL
jgi:hypothetical protein